MCGYWLVCIQEQFIIKNKSLWCAQSNSFDFFEDAHHLWLSFQKSLVTYSHLSNKHDVTLTDFEKFYPAQNKNPPCTFIDLIKKLSIILQNLMAIFLTVILRYKYSF